MSTALVILAVASVGLLVLVAHKVRRVHLMAYELARDRTTARQADAIFRQVQALIALESTLGLGRHLPPLRGWAASPDFLEVVMNHVLDHRPKAIIECGSGSSTIVIARCLQLNGGGHVFSLDHEPEFAAKTRETLRRAGLESFATVIDAPLVAHRIDGKAWSWYDAARLPDGPFDMAIIDGPPMPIDPMIRYPAGPVLLPRLAPAGVMVLDDTIRPGEQECVERWMRADPSLIKTVHDCEKGCVALARAPNAGGTS